MAVHETTAPSSSATVRTAPSSDTTAFDGARSQLVDVAAEKTVVAHLLWAYLPRTQTFVYELLTHLHRVRPVVVTEAFENLDLFPFDDLVEVPRRSMPLRASDKVSSMVNGRLPFRERRYSDSVLGAGTAIMHGHFGWSAPLTLPLKRDLGLPLVTTFYGHDMSATLNLEPKWRAIYEELFELGDTFLVEGNHMRQGLVDLGCPAEKLVVQRIGVDVSGIPVQPAERSGDAPVKVLVCGSFLEKKGIRYAIEGFAGALRQRPGMELQIVGDGPERAQYEALVQELGVADSVDMLGYRTHAEYLEMAQTADIFLAPSVTASTGETEGGAPTVLLEMQASGVPVVSTFHADIPEVVLDGESGFLVPERDGSAVADRIVELADDADLRRRMGLRGRRHIEEHHDIVKQAAKLERIYLACAY